MAPGKVAQNSDAPIRNPGATALVLAAQPLRRQTTLA